jgi:hypothetical protein
VVPVLQTLFGLEHAMGVVLFLVASAVILFVQRCFLILAYFSWFRQGYAGDGAFHFAAVRELRRAGRYAGVSEFLMRDEREPDTYPILFHRFAALFPFSVISRRPYVPNLVIWTLFGTLAVAYAYYVGSSLFRTSGFAVSSIFLLVFLFSASNLSLEANGLNYISLSERLLARFASAFYFAAMAVGLSFDDRLSLGISVVAGTISLITSLFGRQALAFVTPFVALFTGRPEPLYIFGLSFLGACILDRSYFLRGLRHQVLFSRAYNRIVKKSPYFRPALSRFIDLRKVFGRGTPMFTRIYEFEHGEPIQFLIRQPELILVVFLTGWHAELGRPLSAVIVSSLVVYALTTTSWLRHFGEAIRYLEYCLWLLLPLMLSVYFIEGDRLPSVVLILYGQWIGFFASKRILDWWAFPLPFRDEMAELVEHVGIRANDTVFAVPHNLGADVSVRCGARALNYQGVAVTEWVYEKFVEEPPLLKRDWRTLAREFCVTHIVADKRILSTMGDVVGWEYDFSSLPTVGETSLYIVYSVVPTHLSAGGRTVGVIGEHVPTLSEI